MRESTAAGARPTAEQMRQTFSRIESIIEGLKYTPKSKAEMQAALRHGAEAIETLEQAIAVLDRVAPLDEGESKPLPQRIADEMADYSVVADHCAKAYDYLTGGRITKPMTLWRSVEPVADDHFTEQLNEAVKEAAQEAR